MDRDVSKILEDISNGTITNWYEFEMKSALFGLEINSNIIIGLMSEFFNTCTYKFLYKTMTEESVMDEYFSSYPIISKLLELNNTDIYDDDYTTSVKVDALGMLKSLDTRNPKYLLKYFLYDNTQPNSRNRDSYFALFMNIIERTKIRASKMEVFNVYLSRLKDSYDEKLTFEMMSM